KSEEKVESEKKDDVKAEKKEVENTEEKEKDDQNEDVSPESLGVTMITMPLLSDTMKEGVIAEWNFKVGDKIESDDVLADVETDKATMEVTAYAEGALLYIGVKKGEAAKVNDVIAI